MNDDTATGNNNLLSTKDLVVKYGSITALNKVSLDLKRGEIVGLVGHNGAGKTTFVNAITGAVEPTAGEIRINDIPIKLSLVKKPSYMADLGLKIIHQEPCLTGILSIADNITFRSVGEKQKENERIAIARRALKKVGSNLDPRQRVAEISFGERQIVDVAHALNGEVKVLLLNEPTAALGKDEIDHLHGIIQDLAHQGKAIVYVSHRLRDILEICDRIIVLRDGGIVMDRRQNELTIAALKDAVSPNVAEVDIPPSTVLTRKEAALKVSWQDEIYSFYRGEVAGLFGMAGGMQFKFLRHLYGLSGHGAMVEINGEEHDIDSPKAAMNHGIYYVSGDREKESLFHSMSALSNICLPWLEEYSTSFRLFRKKMEAEYTQAKAKLNITGPPMYAAISKFSGGNRQKHVLGRWLLHTAKIKIFLLAQPFQGVDIGARADIAKAINHARQAGITVVVASSEVDEISHLCDRAYVCEETPWVESNRDAGWDHTLLKILLSTAKRKNDSGRK